jgi:hypothetical protein
MRVKGQGRSIGIALASVLAGTLVCAATSACATVNVRDLMQSQKARDEAFRTLKATSTEYTFDYVVIQIPPGSLPGIDVSVPVSHIRFKSTIFFAFNKSDVEPSAERAITTEAKEVFKDGNQEAKYTLKFQKP